MKACIAVADYYSPGQTFVNRHIDKLFDGDTVVVAGRLNDQRPTPHDRFFERRSKDMPLSDKLIAPAHLLFNYAMNGTARLPFGAQKRRLEAFLKDQKPDVVLSEFGTQAVVIAPVAAGLGLPVFTYFRGSDASSRVEHKHVRRAYKAMMPKLDGVVSVSQFLLDNLERHGITHPNDIVIPSGVNVRWFTPEEKPPLSFMTVGRFVEKKAPLTTLQAFADATQDRPEARLTMIGDGELFEATKARAGELGVLDKVRFPGALPHEQVRDLMVRSEVYIQHSVTAKNGNTEGLPTAIQEALACGCVVVSTRHAGIPEAVEEGKNGFLVDEFDAAGFTAMTRRVIEMGPDARAQMGQVARATAEARFDNDKLLTKLENYLSDTISRRHKSA